ncbi:MAG: hypothetical protein Tsb0014_38310 [Pleurocapsa sp.]
MLIRNLIKVGGLLLTVVVANSCSAVNQDIAIGQNTNDTESSPELEYGQVILQSASDYVIVPVGVTVDSSYKRLLSSSDDKNISRSQIKSWENFMATNLIFHHQNTDQTHLLLDRKAIIDRFDYLNPYWSSDRNKSSCYSETQDSLISQLFIYQLIEQDTNQNGKLDSKDADRGYISDLSGYNLRSITPEKTKLLQWECDQKNNQIVLFTQEELEKNTHYNSLDTIAAYLYNLIDNQLTRITPLNTSLIKWKIDLNRSQIFLEIKQDTNKDRQFSSEDESSIIRFDLTNDSDILDVTNDEIIDQLKYLNSN